jgi:hypothetical protein
MRKRRYISLSSEKVFDPGMRFVSLNTCIRFISDLDWWQRDESAKQM